MRLGLVLGLGTGGAPSVFDPLSVSGIIEDLWAQPSLVTLSGAKVTTWTDRADHASGSDATQGTDANRPTYNATGINGRPSIDFSALTRLNLAMNAALGERTVFIVHSPNGATGTLQCLADWDAGRLFLAHLIDAAGRTGWYDGTFANAGAAATGAQILTYRLRFAGGNAAAMRRNGTTLSSTLNHPHRALAGAGQTIGSDYAATSQYLGKIGRISIFDGYLTDANVQLIERGLGAYYGITVA